MGTFLLTSFPSGMSRNLFEINGDKVNEEIDAVSEFYAMFFHVILNFFLKDQ